MPRSKGYRKQETLDGGYLNVRLSAALNAKLDADCEDYARRLGKPDPSRIRGSYVRELISAGSQTVSPTELETVSREVKSVAWELGAAAFVVDGKLSGDELQGLCDRLLEVAFDLDRIAGER